jgi:PAS domain S-box-containing protein
MTGTGARGSLQPGVASQRQATVDRGARANRHLAGSAVVVAGSPVGPAAMSDDVLRSAFEQSPTGMTVSALDGRWLGVNDAYCAMLGYELAELLEAAHRDVIHPDDVGGDRAFIADALAGRRDSMQREKRCVRKDGSLVWALTRVEVIRDRTGSPLYFVSHVQDLSDRRATLGLLHGSQRTLRAVIDHTPAMISVIGRDHRYRLVNREFETEFGVSSDWIVGRLDTEILPPERIAAERAQTLLVLDGGSAVHEEQTAMRDGRECVRLITRYALRDDDGMIDAVCTVSTDVTERRVEERHKRERLQCSELMYSALAQHRLVLHGQPIVSLESFEPAATELLIRMRTTTRDPELIAPGAFLPDAERFDLIGVIDQWVVDQAVKLAAAGHRVSVNLSAKTVSDSAQIDQIRAAVIANEGAAKNLIFEITETALAENLDAARAFAIRMRKLGCAIALDDFGVGHGTFTYLKRLPIDYLKIDREFVRDLLNDDEDRQVVEAIVGVADQFEIETIAEGVENQATLDELRRMRVDYAQGYWTGRPAPLPQLWKSPMNRRRGDKHAPKS